jgi:hypothetical protein
MVSLSTVLVRVACAVLLMERATPATAVVGRTRNLEFKRSDNITSSIPLDAAALSLSACENVDQSIMYITSLDFNTSSLLNITGKADVRAELRDVYLLLTAITPISIGLLLFGSSMLWPTCILAAACLGVFLVFHTINSWMRGGIDCPMKLSGSVVAAFLAAMAATAFLRFAMFCLGAVAAGGVTYLVFDAFPELDMGDPTAGVDSDSELSPFGWAVMSLMGFLGGWILRWQEEASWEGLTAIMGGIGCAYSLHATIIIRGGQLDRSVVFLLASIASLLGWRFQRRRRFSQYNEYKQLDRGEPDGDFEGGKRLTQHALLQPVPVQAYSAAAGTAQPFQQLQNSLHYMQTVLQQSSGSNGPSSEQISDLTRSINALVERIGSGPDSEELESKES